ncbi:MAG: sorbosone dehydrogenase family protein [Acidobacteria bacterium]|nr:sorbosone dehydrogenase family protein [Acidobacteriota bacterium]
MKPQNLCIRRFLLGIGVILITFGCGPILPFAGPLDLGLVRLPPGFQIAIFAEDLPGARIMAFSPSGILLVSLTQEGSIMALVDPNRTGRATRSYAFLKGLNRPHGLAFRGEDLYVAETGRVLRFAGAEAALHAGRPMQPSQAVTVVSDLPSGGMHFTRTIAFGPNQDLFISVGSDCNVCEERDQKRAAVLRLPADGNRAEVYASGLRNAVGLRINPQDGKLWTTENGRDRLGDNLPPDEINIITGPGNYGWPYCYGNNVPDPEYNDPARCCDKIPAALALPAHNAPLGLGFYQGDKFPDEYRNNLFVALHGSWNRRVPDGYKVVRVRVEEGKPVRWENFATGWLQGGRAWGRPVDVLSGPDGALYVSDDSAGVIYSITYGE